MKSPIAAIAGAAAALVASSMLGVAAAEAPTTTSLRTVSVEGVASEPLAQGANAASATAVYRQAMAAAVADGQAKAEFLAQKVGATVGVAQSVAEGGGGISCTGGGESGYVQYEGEQPDFGYGQPVGGIAAPAAPAVAGAPSSTSSKPRPRKKKKHRTTPAVKAAATSCTLNTQVSLIYTLG